MITYIGTAAALKCFSLSPATKWAYRQFANTYSHKSAGQFANTITAVCIPETRFDIKNLDYAISPSLISSTL
jgi:hypothetical protein